MRDTSHTTRDARILVVDHDEIDRAMVDAILRGAGFHNILCVPDGPTALAVLSCQRFDCILLASTMPGMDGLEVCRRIHDSPATELTPILVQSSLKNRHDFLAAFSAGASDVVRKPVDPRELIARVNIHTDNALMSKRLRDDRDRFQAESQEAAALMGLILPTRDHLAALRDQGFVFDWFTRPSQTIGGDLWAAWQISDTHLGLFFADVSGHGVAAALRAFSLYSLLMPPPPFSNDPLHIAAHLDQRVHSLSGRSFQFVAAFYGVYDTTSRTLSYVAGGLRDGFLFRNGQPPTRLDFSGLPLGLMPVCPRQIRTVTIEPDDHLILFSDALVEHFGLDPALQTEETVAAWLTEQMQTQPHGPGLMERIGQEFLAVSPDCHDDLLIVAANLHPSTTP